MNPGKVTPGQLFSDNTQQFWVPRYQRRYEWGPDKLHGLWQDLAALFNGETTKSHFFGIILGSPKSYPEGPPSTRIEVIDGQQRITTLLILLAAIFEHKNEVSKRKPIKFASHPLYFLTDHERKPTKHRILELQSSDGKELDDVMAGKWRKKYHQNNKSGVLEAFIYFRYCLWIGRKSFDAIEEYEVPRARNKKDLKLQTPEELWNKYLLLADKDAKAEPLSKSDCAKLDDIVRSKLSFLNIQLEADDEDPVVIFDSINGKRLEFSQWNHTRSYFFRTIGDNDELFNKWDKTEDVGRSR